jgi:hypothetical protein
MLVQERLQEEWYESYYNASGTDRNDIVAPGAQFQALAFQLSLIRALSSVHLDPVTSSLLDVGCGSAAGLYH